MRYILKFDKGLKEKKSEVMIFRSDVEKMDTLLRNNSVTSLVLFLRRVE